MELADVGESDVDNEDKEDKEDDEGDEDDEDDEVEGVSRMPGKQSAARTDNVSSKL